MNNIRFNKVDWINIIIFNCFQEYLKLGELQVLSMLAKLTRSKLNPILFKSIQLITERKHLDGSVVKNFNSKSCDELNNFVNKGEVEIKESLGIQNSLNDINSELEDIKHFANSFYIYDVKRLGHYIDQFITNFTNLSILKIHCSTISYSIFQKLGEYFPFLKSFELYKVVLSKYLTNSDNSNEIIFPPNLISLSIWHVDVTDIDILCDPYKIVFNCSSQDARSEYSLPNISILSLKNLLFLRCATKNSGLEEFLETNPNLNQLNIDNFNPEMSKNFNSLKSLHLEKICDYENLENLNVNYSIKTLKINSEDEFNYEKFEKLCLMCPSVEMLQFSTANFGIYQKYLDAYLVPILNKLPNLKTLELSIEVADEDIELIDINHYPQIEKIIFETGDVANLSICFEKNLTLKEIEFNSLFYDIDKEEFLESYENYTDWEFKFYKRKIKGYRV